MIDKLEDFYLSKEEPNKSCLLALREIILSTDENIHETVKYGMPCFCLGKKMFSYLWVDKKTHHPYILMVDGQLIDHPRLVKGNRARMTVFPVDPNKDLPLQSIKEVLNAGLALCGSSTKTIK